MLGCVRSRPAESDDRAFTGGPRTDPERWVAVLGFLSALALSVSPFLPWVLVERAQAERVGAAVAEQARAEPAEPGSDAFLELGERVAERGELTGLDLAQWSRAARARQAERIAATGAEGGTASRIRRGFLLLSGTVLGVAAAGAVVAGYLLAHRFARWRAPTLVLAGLAGLTAVTLAAALAWVARSVQPALSTGSGRTALVAGGVGLLATVLGSLTWENLLRVLGGLLLAALALGGLLVALVVGGP